MRLLVASVIVVFSGCGGTDANDLFAGGAGAARTGDGGGVVAGAASSSGGSGGDRPAADTGGQVGTGGAARGGAEAGGGPPGGHAGDSTTASDAAVPARDAAAPDASEGAETGLQKNQVVRCGTLLTCDLGGGEVCCVTFSLQQGTTYACLEPEAPTSSCNSAVRYCDGAGDCASGEVCCAEWRTSVVTSRYADFTCEESCGSTDAIIECRGRADCPSGQLCCGALTDDDTRYTSLTCGDTCDDQIICDSAEDCPDPSGYDCVQSNILPPGWGHCVSN
jgi:hypothetical protein